MSLRARILVLTVGVAAAVLVLFSVPLVLLLHQAATQEARENATDAAQGVADYLSTGGVDVDALGDYVDRINDRDDNYPVEVVLPDGTRVGESLPAADDDHGDGDDDDDDDDDDRYGSLSPTSDARLQSVEGGEVVTIQVSTPGAPITVSAFISDSAVWETVEKRLVVLGASALVLLLAAAGAAELVSRRLVRHLTAAAQTADRLCEGDMTARVPDDGPEEVRRVGAALNRLASRIDELLAAERETVADLSHRLRTPLTAVRLDVESLPDSDRKVELEEHLAHLERTLTAVIHAARRPQREGALPHCDAGAVARARFEYWAPLAEDQRRELSLSVGAGPLAVRCADADLASAVDALLENAVAHTPDGTDVAVVVSTDPNGTVRLDVRDRGPGIPPNAVRRGRSDRGSTGLGLDIARSCAEASGGALELATVDGWAVVRLILGRP